MQGVFKRNGGMKQTAVEWLIDQFEKHENGQIDWMSRSATKSEALQMEKEQIKEAYKDGSRDLEIQYSDVGEINSEQYYNETYKDK